MSEPIDTKELRRLYEAATPGEWHVEKAANNRKVKPYVVLDGKPDHDDYEGMPVEKAWKGDAIFISAAHNALPALLDEVDRLTAENAALRQRDAEAREVAKELVNSTFDEDFAYNLVQLYPELLVRLRALADTANKSTPPRAGEEDQQ